MRDDHGQPTRPFRARAVAERNIDELIGLCRGVLADGVLVVEEAQFLMGWLDRHRDVANQWPANVLYERIERALADGVMDLAEERELIAILMQTTGDPVTVSNVASMSTSLPLDNPPPTVICRDRTFCMTGKFLYGSRAAVEASILALGGEVCGSPSSRTNYLVIGAAGSRDWVHSTYGRKIEKAVELRDSGKGIAILGEEHWVSALPASRARS